MEAGRGPRPSTGSPWSAVRPRVCTGRWPVTPQCHLPHPSPACPGDREHRGPGHPRPPQASSACPGLAVLEWRVLGRGTGRRDPSVGPRGRVGPEQGGPSRGGQGGAGVSVTLDLWSRQPRAWQANTLPCRGRPQAAGRHTGWPSPHPVPHEAQPRPRQGDGGDVALVRGQTDRGRMDSSRRQSRGPETRPRRSWCPASGRPAPTVPPRAERSRPARARALGEGNRPRTSGGSASDQGHVLSYSVTLAPSS